MSNMNGSEGSGRRGNIAPVSINLPRVAIESDGDFVKFLSKLDSVLNLCERQLLHRYSVLKQLKGKDIPFVIGQNLIEGAQFVDADDSIEPILIQGTYGIGFIGLSETMMYLFGKHHGESDYIYQQSLSVVRKIREFCDEASERNLLNFTCYATPAEGLSERFVAIDKKKYGIIKGVTDKDYYTNSFHITPGFPIGVVRKFELEAPFHNLCNAGHISYVELDAPPVDDIDVVERTVDWAVKNTDIGYFGFNYGEIYCKDDGTPHIKGNICPECKGSNLQGVYRVTGYLSLAERFGKGKEAERKDRKSHL